MSYSSYHKQLYFALNRIDRLASVLRKHGVYYFDEF
jgi:hypothetical protein